MLLLFPDSETWENYEVAVNMRALVDSGYELSTSNDKYRFEAISYTANYSDDSNTDHCKCRNQQTKTHYFHEPLH